MTAAISVESPYLQGNYAPVHSEIAADALEVVGEIPRDLAGVFVRNSSNPRFLPEGRYHWFDGDGMIHAIHFEDGKARYRNRWIRTKAFLAEEEAGHALWKGVTERPDFTNPGGPFKDTANTDLVYHAGRLLALWWLGGEPYVVHLPDLETSGIETYGGKLKTLSAHPKVDPRTGEMMFFDYKPFPPYLTYGVISASGELVHRTDIDLPGPRLQHDMAITERYSILLDMSMMWDPELLAQGKTRVRFFRDKPARFGVLPRLGQGHEIRWFESSAFYMYHTVNAWEEGEKIVILGCKIENPLADDPQNPQGRREAPSIGFLRLDPCYCRWTLDLVTGKVTEERLDDAIAEFPRMDNRALGRKSRYSYHARLAAAATMRFDAVIKYDADTGQQVTHEYAKGSFGGETPFAPRVGGTGEDDGYLLTFVADEQSGASEMHVLDARALDRGPVARVKIPQRVPTGYHTYWVPADELARQRSA
ncbi:MAG: carotenoid oxygenase family protein [Minicystis sp.]